MMGRGGTRPYRQEILYSFLPNPHSRRVLIDSVTRVQPELLTVGVQPGFARNLEAAIARSQQFLLAEQKPEGFWVGELMVDSTLVSDTVAYHHWNGKVDPEWQRKAVNHIFRCNCRTAAGTSITAGRRR